MHIHTCYVFGKVITCPQFLSKTPDTEKVWEEKQIKGYSKQEEVHVSLRKKSEQLFLWSAVSNTSSAAAPVSSSFILEEYPS